MNTIIIYSSKYGCAKDCAAYIKSGLSGSVTLADIEEINMKDTGLKNYDTIILGSSIYVGSISKKMRSLCKENMDLLNTKKLGIFLCSAFSKQTKVYLAANFPEMLLKSAVAIQNFGGEARVDKMKLVDKLIMKAALKGENQSLKISYDDMDIFIKKLAF